MERRSQAWTRPQASPVFFERQVSLTFCVRRNIVLLMSGKGIEAFSGQQFALAQTVCAPNIDLKSTLRHLRRAAYVVLTSLDRPLQGAFEHVCTLRF